MGGRPRFDETLPWCCDVLRWSNRVDCQPEYLLRPVQGASSAEPSDLLGVVGLGVARDVVPDEAVGGTAGEPHSPLLGESYCFRGLSA